MTNKDIEQLRPADLRPCPFCGNDEEFYVAIDRLYVSFECDHCSACLRIGGRPLLVSVHDLIVEWQYREGERPR